MTTLADTLLKRMSEAHQEISETKFPAHQKLEQGLLDVYNKVQSKSPSNVVSALERYINKHRQAIENYLETQGPKLENERKQLKVKTGINPDTLLSGGAIASKVEKAERKVGDHLEIAFLACMDSVLKMLKDGKVSIDAKGLAHMGQLFKGMDEVKNHFDSKASEDPEKD
jgi:uncharacterized protein YqeY